MHIVYIHQYFCTSMGSAGIRSYEFARRWVKQGHKVTMVTTTANLTNYDLANATGGLFKRFVVDDIDVIAVSIAYETSMSFPRRIVSFLTFLITASLRILFISKVDVAYATSTPLTIGIPAIVLKWLKRVPFVFEVRDQWPEVPIELGILRSRIIIKLLLWLEKTIYKQSAAIVALSPDMADGVKRVIGLQKHVALIPNCSDIHMFHPDIDGCKIRSEKGWTNKLVFLHAGAISMANGLDFVIDAAEKLRKREDIHFVLIGDGSRKDVLSRRVKQNDLSNVEMLGGLPHGQLPEFFAAADVSMVIFGNYPIFEHNSANKFFDSLSAGKAVLLNYSGWQRDVLEKYHAGFGCNQCDLNEFVENVLYLHSHRDELAEMGRNARQLAVEQFSRDKLSQQALEIVESVGTKI